ncbi:MAG: endonuclease/exonuclease/phosphatase family protein, partial [Chitinophagaceae bacterium]
VRSQTISMPEKFADKDEEPMIADIKVGNDTFSVMNIHLQSYGFREPEYRDLAKIRSQEDKQLRATRNIFRKMRIAIEHRNRQADLLSEKIKNATYPLLICGDMNDVPASYAYKTIRGDMEDAFLENGFGLGKTFISGRSRVLGWLPTLRIDYIFHDERILSTQFKRLTKHQSDHHGLIADIELPKKW